MTKYLFFACILLGALAIGNGAYADRLRLRVKLTEQRAGRAEAQLAALQSAAVFDGDKISALRDYARQCEEARAREAAEAAALWADMGPQPSPPRGEEAAQGGNHPPRISSAGPAARPGEASHARRAVVDRLNRPL